LQTREQGEEEEDELDRGLHPYDESDDEHLPTPEPQPHAAIATKTMNTTRMITNSQNNAEAIAQKGGDRLCLTLPTL
jgi:hypothetical protein